MTRALTEVPWNPFCKKTYSSPAEAQVSLDKIRC